MNTPYWWEVFKPIRGARAIRGFDGWCGMGVGTMAILETCRRNGWYIKNLTAVNHWDEAIKIHAAMFPNVAHFCAKMESTDPKVLVPDGELDMMTAGIKCQPFSRAAGGIERNEQERMDFYEVLRYATDLRISTIVLENVADFMKWGPLTAEGRPIKRLEGTLFNNGMAMLRALNYKVEWRVLKACWYGDPTSRERLWIVAKKGTSRKIFFPEPTHRDPNQEPDMFNAHLPTWPVAKDIIDFSLPTHSIFGSKLVPNTLSRILAGADKFAGLRLEFQALPGCPPMPVKKLKKGARVSPYAQSAWNLHYLNCALRVANGKKLDQKNLALIGRVSPKAVKMVRDMQQIGGILNPKDAAKYMIKLYGTSNAASLDEALPTVTQGNHLGMVMVNKGGGDGYERNTGFCDPIPTLTTRPSTSVVDFLIPQQSQGEARSVNQAVPTIATKGAIRTVGTFLVSGEHVGSGDRVSSGNEPMPTLTRTPDWSVAAAFLSVFHGDRDGVHATTQPIPTLDTSNRFQVAYIATYYGSELDGQDIDNPLRTVPTKDRFLLVVPGYGWMDIRTRLLVLDELRKAHSIPDDFSFASVSIENGKKMVGNSWALKMGTEVINAAMH